VPDVQLVEVGEAVAVPGRDPGETLAIEDRRAGMRRVPGLGEDEVLDCNQAE
jgi:hypothetical protein